MGNEINLEQMMSNSANHNNPNEKDPFNNKIHLKYGIAAGVIIILLFVIYYLLGWSYEKDFKSWIPSICFMLLIVIAQFKHTKVVNGEVSFGNLFAKGFKTAAVATCIYVVFLIVFIWLNPGYKQGMLDISQQQMIDQGLDMEEVKAGIKMAKEYFMASAISGAVLGELVLGLIASLAGAASAPKNNKPTLKPLS